MSDVTEELPAGELEARPAAPREASVAILVCGLMASAVIPGYPPGLNVVLVAFGLAGAVAVARPRRINVEVVVYAALGLALSAIVAIRAAEWVVGLSSLMALGLAALVVAGGSTWGQIVRAPLVVVARTQAGIPFLGRGLVGPRAGAGLRRWAPAARGVAIAAFLLVVFGGLFASADRAFAHLASELLVPDDLSLLPARVGVFVLVAVLGGAYAAAGARYLSLGTPWPIRGSVIVSALEDDRRAPLRIGRTEWTIALVALDVLFAVFVGLQVAVLFGGRDHVLRTAGLTYAEYARQGFFQLLAVATLTIAVVALTARFAARAGRRDTLRFQALLGVLCALTLVVLASSLRRLGLYEEAFGFTRARLFAHAVIFGLAAILILLLVAGATLRGWWLPRAVVAMSAIGMLALGLMNPDGWVAARNVERFRETGSVDLRYLRTLSADAVPALVELPPRLHGCVLSEDAVSLSGRDPWLAWNLGRATARSALGDVQPLRPCRWGRLLPTLQP